MNVEFKSSFVRDLKKVKDPALLHRVREQIEQAEGASTLEEFTQIKKLRGSNRYYRLRLGDYRIGLLIEGEIITFVRFLHRKDIYRYFP